MRLRASWVNGMPRTWWKIVPEWLKFRLETASACTDFDRLLISISQEPAESLIRLMRCA